MKSNKKWKKNDVANIEGEGIYTCYGNGEVGVIIEVTGGKAYVQLSGVMFCKDWFRLSQLSKVV